MDFAHLCEPARGACRIRIASLRLAMTTSDNRMEVMHTDTPADISSAGFIAVAAYPCEYHRMTQPQRVFVFGNPDIAMDSLPLRLLPALREAFPTVSFATLDPNEEWDVPEHMVIIDTVVGINEVTVFDNLDVFTKAPRVTCHDFDAYANLMLLRKLGKLHKVTIVGVPVNTQSDRALAMFVQLFPHLLV